MDTGLAGRTAIVCGASAGIGWGFAGAEVVRAMGVAPVAGAGSAGAGAAAGTSADAGGATIGIAAVGVGSATASVTGWYASRIGHQL